MYKLILADDEEDVREGLLQLIDWESVGFAVADTAENGKEAAEMVEKHVPDVVVTDIQMPFMNGLQLAEWIRGHYPATKIIILTGYEEFEYAQKAIRLGIDEYILKPFSAAELADILRKVKEQIDAELAEKENVQLLTEHYRKNLPVLQSLFLSSLVSRRLRETEIQEKSQHYGLDLNGSEYMVSVLRIDAAPGRKEAAGNGGGDKTRMASGSISLKDTNDTQLRLFAVYNIADEIVKGHPADKAFIHHDEVVLLSIRRHEGSEDLAARTLQLLEEIRFSVERFLKLTVTIGAGRAAARLNDAVTSYEEALKALDYRVILGGNKVIWIEDVESREYVPLAVDELKEKELVRCLKVGSDQELERLLEDMFGVLADNKVSYQDFQVYLLEMLTAVIKVAKDSHADLDKLFGEGPGFLGTFAKFAHADEAKAWFLDICMKLKHSIASDRQSSYNKLVEEAKEYILANYGDHDLSIAKVCRHLHISAGYFSNIFKKETKTTFVSYLLGVRMEAAQRLLAATDLKAFEIAERVGFSDPNYFSFCFRKKFGISPKEYRGGARNP
ncbi:MAG: response regulator [Paenibacillus macerans]|uniref:Response regulator n=1 Tax=Paenibacillus macerans TaxID=44252 RepID=A0A6N8F172_PAEMA|nr:response regulator [Paenibacillus macerans]MDU7477203.1 response regulator [Paenibacillus macerans]MEC0140806.1 response regulator [Paenibacillus macerans]MEC0154419.1 response regulator [Paenibacillus macerans]MEC0331003.1 response regulator [Paenibacillus macerans]MUG24653.1 response regulator [Paenibacillus macerans]